MKLEVLFVLLILLCYYICNKPVEHFANVGQKELIAADKLKVDKLWHEWVGAWHPIIRRGCIGQEICAEGRGEGSDLIQKKTLENLLNLVKNALQHPSSKRIKLHMYMLKGTNPWSVPASRNDAHAAALRGLTEVRPELVAQVIARGYIGSISLWTHLGGNDSDPDNTTIDFMKGMKHAENHVREKLTYYLTKFPVDEAAAATAAAPEGLPRRHHVYLHRWKLGHMAKDTQYFKDLNIEKNGVISYKDFFEKECIPQLTGRTPDGPNKEKNIENKCLELWRSYLGPEKKKLSDTEIKKSTSKINDLAKYAWMNSNSRKLFLEKNIKATSKQNTIASKKKKPVQEKPQSVRERPQIAQEKPEVAQPSCNGPPACKNNATKTLGPDGQQSFARCKSGCGTKVAKLGYICCDTGCCNPNNSGAASINANLPNNSLEKRKANAQATKNIDVVKKIGSRLNTNDIPDADMKEANMYMNTINMITSQIAGVRGSLNKMSPKILGIMDTDNSNKISKEEVRSKLPLVMKNIDVAIDYGFKQLDTNNSGGIEKKELHLLRQMLNKYADDAVDKTYTFVDTDKSKDITIKELDRTLKIIGNKWDRVTYMSTILLKLIHEATNNSSANKSLFLNKKIITGNSGNSKDFSKEVANIKKTLLQQDATIKKLEGRVTDSNDKFYATANKRDAKLLEANDEAVPLDPAKFSYKPKIQFDHKQPSAKVASAYGWSFMPPHFWSVPQKRPPACIPSPQNTATVTPIYDKSVPVDALDYTQVGSILPKFEYNEVYNPDYYYPGWIAKKKEPYPGKNGKAVMKSGEYYSMNRAQPTGLKPFGKKIIDENIHSQTVIHKPLIRKLEKPPQARRIVQSTTPPAQQRGSWVPPASCKVFSGPSKFNNTCRTGSNDAPGCSTKCGAKAGGIGNICCSSDCCPVPSTPEAIAAATAGVVGRSARKAALAKLSAKRWGTSSIAKPVIRKLEKPPPARRIVQSTPPPAQRRGSWAPPASCKVFSGPSKFNNTCRSASKDSSSCSTKCGAKAAGIGNVCCSSDCCPVPSTPEAIAAATAGVVGRSARKAALAKLSATRWGL